MEKELHNYVDNHDAEGVHRVLSEALAPVVESLLNQGPALPDSEFEILADQLADEFTAYVGSATPSLSDAAISRAGIYEDHP